MKSLKRKAFFPALAIALLALYGMYHVMKGREIPVPQLFQPVDGSRLLISMKGFRFTQSQNGRVTLRVLAGNADLFENRQAHLKEIEIIFSGQENGEAVLRGEKGVLDTAKGDATIRSTSREVRVVTGDGYLLTTSSLLWKAEERLVRTNDAFKLLGPEIYLEGRGISAHIDRGTITVEKNVKAVLQE